MIGKILYIRAVYGHGGRLNYEKEWRFKKKISGGGELIDKGSHLIDLSRFFLGDLKVSFSRLKNYFWKINGLGKSYGEEKLILYKMKKQMGKPPKKIFRFKKKDISWNLELKEFYNDIEKKRNSNLGLIDIYKNLLIINQIYKKNDNN
jgi:hypothetical protein